MRKIITICITAILLCSVIAVLVQAQNANTLTNNLTASKDATNQDVVNKAIQDYLSGKTKEFYVPGSIKADVSQKVPYIICDDLPVTSFIRLTDKKATNLISPMGTGSGLLLEQYDSPGHCNTYIVFGKDIPTANSVYPNSVSGRVNCYSNLMDASGQTENRFDQFTMHYYGQNPYTHAFSENVIQAVRVGNTVTFNFMVNGQFTSDHFQGPASNTYAIYMKVNNPSGTTYNEVEFDVYDINRGMDFNLKKSTQTFDKFWVDMALEKRYNNDGTDNDCPPSTIVWKWITNFVVYDRTQTPIDLLHTGKVVETYMPSVENPLAGNQDYVDFYDYTIMYPTYQLIPNGIAEMYMTRYNPANSPPSHP